VRERPIAADGPKTTVRATSVAASARVFDMTASMWQVTVGIDRVKVQIKKAGVRLAMLIEAAAAGTGLMNASIAFANTLSERCDP
jgi:hypothetical protein